jgi:hypothetical protein
MGRNKKGLSSVEELVMSGERAQHEFCSHKCGAVCRERPQQTRHKACRRDETSTR